MIPDFGTVSSALIALSGGVDSAVLLRLAVHAGIRTEAAVVVSEFLPSSDLAAAERFAEDEGVRLNIIRASYLDDDEIRSNPENRCYLCKKRMASYLVRCAEERGLEAVFEGTNASDGIRPGRKALEESGILMPLSGTTKEEITAYARSEKIPVRPPSACLATRIPYHTELSETLLKTVDEAESRLRQAGISGILRVRLDRNMHAAVEVSPHELTTAELSAEKLISLGITVDTVGLYRMQETVDGT